MRILPILLIATMLAVSAPAAGQASAREVSAEGWVQAASTDAVVMMNLAAARFTLQAASAELTLVDDWMEVYTTPWGSEAVAVEAQRDTQTFTMRGMDVASTSTDPDGVLLVPQARGDFRAVAAVRGRLDAVGASDQVLERSHFYPRDGVDPLGAWNFHDYEYRAGDGLALTMNGSAQHAVHGDFTIYLWGTTFRAVHNDGAVTHRTGYYQTSSPTDGGNGVLVRQHHVHAILDVTDGILSASSPDSALYGDAFALDLDGVALLSGAGGSLSSTKGTHQLSGGVTVQDGVYDLTRGDGGIEIAVQERPSGVAGSIATTEAQPILPVGAVAGMVAALVVAVGMVYARPAVVAGIGERRYRRVALVPPPRMTWRELRAEGHRRMAHSAEARGGYRRALRHMDRALHIEPGNPQTLSMRGSLLRQLGQHQAAVESHRRAHEWLDALDEDGEETGSNAYEAARACALDGRSDDALHWLGIAVRSDGDLCAEVAAEPDFASIRGTTEYLSLMRGWKPRYEGSDDLLAP